MPWVVGEMGTKWLPSVLGVLREQNRKRADNGKRKSLESRYCVCMWTQDTAPGLGASHVQQEVCSDSTGLMSWEDTRGREVGRVVLAKSAYRTI